jgi:hypothetical protein
MVSGEEVGPGARGRGQASRIKSSQVESSHLDLEDIFDDLLLNRHNVLDDLPYEETRREGGGSVHSAARHRTTRSAACVRE